MDERFGAGVWTAGSYDPALDLVYFGVSNTYDSSGAFVPEVFDPSASVTVVIFELP